MATRRRLPTAEELRIWRDFIETAETLRARLSTRLQQESALSSGDYQVLLALAEAPGRRLRSSELAAEPPCPELVEELTGYAAGEIDQATCTRIEEHLKRCPRCAAGCDCELEVAFAGAPAVTRVLTVARSGW